jgi:hypothetical protein
MNFISNDKKLPKYILNLIAEYISPTDICKSFLIFKNGIFSLFYLLLFKIIYEQNKYIPQFLKCEFIISDFTIQIIISYNFIEFKIIAKNYSNYQINLILNSLNFYVIIQLLNILKLNNENFIYNLLKNNSIAHSVLIHLSLNDLHTINNIDFYLNNNFYYIFNELENIYLNLIKLLDFNNINQRLIILSDIDINDYIEFLSILYYILCEIKLFESRYIFLIKLNDKFSLEINFNKIILNYYKDFCNSSISITINTFNFYILLYLIIPFLNPKFINDNIRFNLLNYNLIKNLINNEILLKCSLMIQKSSISISNEIELLFLDFIDFFQSNSNN